MSNIVSDMVIKIGPLDIDVFFIPGDNEDFGDFTYLQSQIRVDSRLKSTALVDTLLHEILHAIAYTSGETLDGGRLHGENNEESVVNNFANYLTQVFRDNKWLLHYFVNNLLDKTKK